MSVKHDRIVKVIGFSTFLALCSPFIFLAIVSCDARSPDGSTFALESEFVSTDNGAESIRDGAVPIRESRIETMDGAGLEEGN